MLVSGERGKPENWEKNLSEQGENQQQTQPINDTRSGNRTWATLLGGEHSLHCVTLALPSHSKRESLSVILQAIVAQT